MTSWLINLLRSWRSLVGHGVSEDHGGGDPIGGEDPTPPSSSPRRQVTSGPPPVDEPWGGHGDSDRRHSGPVGESDRGFPHPKGAMTTQTTRATTRTSDTRVVTRTQNLNPSTRVTWNRCTFSSLNHGVRLTLLVSFVVLPPGRSVAKESGTKALADASIGFDQVQEAHVGYVFGDSSSGQRAVYELGMTGIPVTNVNNNCSTGSTALYLAARSIRGGLADCVLALGFEKMEPGSLTQKWEDREHPMLKHIMALAKLREIEMPPTVTERAAAFSRLPPQSGQVVNVTARSTKVRMCGWSDSTSFDRNDFWTFGTRPS